MKVIFRTVVIVGKTDTARVEEELVSEPADQLCMRIPACQHLTGIEAEKFLKFHL